MTNTKRSLMTSVVALLLCFSMLLGTTYAWFTDSVTSGGNVIQSGNLDVEMYWSEKLLAADSTEWQNADGTPIFTHENWEPGYTEVRYVKIKNAGSLAFKWKLNIEAEGTFTELADVIDVYYIDPAVEVTSLDGRLSAGSLSEVVKEKTALDGVLLPKDEVSTEHPVLETIVAIALHMDEEAGNKYQKSTLGCGFSVSLLATQFGYEEDSFGKDYDKDAQWPNNVTVGALYASSSVSLTADNKVAAGVTMSAKDNEGNETSAEVPAGVSATKDKLTLTITPKSKSEANIVLNETEAILPLDVHIDGVAEDNEIVIKIKREKLLPVGLNLGNHQLYHVEDGKTVAMTLLENGATPVHNNYEYDPATGDVVFYLKSFSEIALVAEPAKWEGNRDYSWYTNAVAPVDGESKADYIIANGDQLAAFGAIVGGMDGQTQDSFSGKTVKLIADINLGDKESENNPSIIFYPIGYYNSEGTYERTNTAITSGLRNFMGTFDGNGHKISNFYQNTWEMKGDHDWYSPEEQYYRDGMGLFGKVYGGTVKNLTVENFKSDGEIATTGVIAAYADGATFENIAIFNCNPRVYNIGNGGIVGCVGWYAKEADLKTTFTNITVDNSNKISALWGSYDVACGGIVGQYYPTSGQTSAGTPKNAGIHFNNCHVSAQMDVYNDVCANYQYYAYRYTGMLIGSIRENETIDGHVYPKMDGITASGCTVHFGDWNDYYYCELVANSLASYTHDHQMSRLEQVASVDVANKTVTDLKGNTTAIPSSGRVNYVVVKAKGDDGKWIHGDGHDYAECYHFVNGVQHFHDVADADNPNPTEMVNGVETLKEDKQLIYREFNQLFTGYGWGVTSKGLTDYKGVENMDITAGDHEESVKKFDGKVNELANNKEYKLSDIFTFVDNGVELVPGALTVSVNNLDENNPVSAEFNRNIENWENGTLTLTGTGYVQITIQDYYFCTPTTITVTVTDRQPEEKFDVVMNNGDFLHRVGNVGTVTLDKLFKAKDDVTVGTINVTVEAVDGTGASGKYSNNAIQFSGTGVVKVTITDNDYCIPTVLYLEVVDAVNATKATDATSNNVVLLNDIGSGFTISGDNTVFGNGFTLNYTNDGRYLNNGLKQGVVMVQNGGTLDNLHIKASIYPTAFMYYGTTQMGDYVQQDSNPREVEGDKTRYYYQLSAVATFGDATISNCYIYGGRTNVYINTGNVTIEDTILECGIVANTQIQSTSEYTVVLDNVTTIQYQVNATVGDTSKVMLGAGVLVGPDTTSNPQITLSGNFKQYNWVNADDKSAVSSTMAQMIIQGALDATAYNHTINGKTASNLGIIIMNEEKITITNDSGLPYENGTVTMSLDNGGSINGQVYSLQNATESQIYSDYANADRSTVNGDYLPTFEFNLGDQEISYDGSEDTRYLYGDKNGITALYKDGEEPLTLDLTKLATIYKYNGITYNVTVVCKDASGNALEPNNGAVTLDTQGDYTIIFTVKDNIFYDKNGKTIDKQVEREFSVPLTLTVKAADIKNATVSITKTALDGVYTTVNLTDYKLRINFLDCISITDYDNKGTGSTVDLTSNISSATLTPASVNVFTTASTITITYTDGRVLTVNLSKISGSSAGTKTASVNTSGGLYFITEGALNNKPTEASSQNKCTITSVSYKGNNGSTVTNDTDVTVTWELGSSGGTSPCVTPDTLITLADGTQKEIQHVTYEDQLLVWDFYKGEYAVVPAAIIFDHGYGDNTVIKLDFSNDASVKVVNMHQFFDATLNKMVTINAENVAQYVGHKFICQDGDGYSTVMLDAYSITNEYVEAWGIMSAQHYNIIVEGIFSADFDPADLGLFNYFEIGENLKYDAEKMQADIEKYGLYTYEDFANHLTYEQFVAFNVQYFKISVEKGNYTFEGILALIDEYLNQ